MKWAKSVKLVQFAESFDGVGRQPLVVAAGDIEQRCRADGTFEVDVKLNLGLGGSCYHPSRLRWPRSRAATTGRRQLELAVLGAVHERVPLGGSEDQHCSTGVR